MEHYVGYKMESSSASAHTTTKTYRVENFKHGYKNDMVANMATLLLAGFLHRSRFSGNLKLSNNKLVLQRPPT